MTSEHDAELELQRLEGEIETVKALLRTSRGSGDLDLSRLEAKRSEMQAILARFAADRSAQEARDRHARLRAHVAAYNALVRKLNEEIVEIRANLPEGDPGRHSGAPGQLRFLTEIETPG